MEIDWVMRKTVSNKRRGIRCTITSILEDLEFADNIALVSSNSDHLQDHEPSEEVEDFTHLGSVIMQ